MVGGAAILATAALYFMLRSRKQGAAVEDVDMQNLDSTGKELLARIKALGEPKFEPSGKLEFQYLLKFMEAVAIQAKLM